MALSPPSTALPPLYVYEPLPTSPPTIRLLKIHDDTSSFDSPIFCEIHHVSLDSASGNGYTGLSYVWGEPIFDQTICCDGCVIKVTSHLHEAIQRLRSRRVSWVWIDAICIDQSNIAERNAQVSIMGRIFKQTQMTFVYLGKVDEDSEQVAGLLIRLAFLGSLLQDRSWRDFELLRDTDSDELVLKAALQKYPYASEHERTWFSQWRHYCTTIFELRETIRPEEADQVLQVLGLPTTDSGLWRRYADLYKLPWFGRGWVIQEAVLSPHVRVMLGNETVDLEDIARSYSFLVHSGLADAKIGIHGSLIHVACEIIDLGEMRRPRALKQLLRTFRVCETTDPRDKIYSVLGLAEDLTIASPKPDYHQSEENVFISYARYMVQHSQQRSLDILTDAGISRGSTLKSGTWVPRWDDRRLHPPFILEEGYYRASGSAKSVCSYGNDSSLLVRGVLFDKVGQLGLEILDHTPWHAWERKVLDQVQHSPGFSTEKFAKALVADFFGLGMKYFSDPSIHSWTFTELYKRALPGRDLPSEVYQYMNMAVNINKTHALVLTHEGDMGRVPGCTEEGDFICIIFGVHMPLVVREVGHGKYILIGAAYIEGVMYGEVFEGTDVEGGNITLL